jgi:hypothetical protein
VPAAARQQRAISSAHASSIMPAAARQQQHASSSMSAAACRQQNASLGLSGPPSLFESLHALLPKSSHHALVSSYR